MKNIKRSKTSLREEQKAIEYLKNGLAILIHVDNNTPPLIANIVYDSINQKFLNFKKEISEKEVRTLIYHWAKNDCGDDVSINCSDSQKTISIGKLCSQ